MKLIAAALLIVLAGAARAAQITVPIYIEDNHAGSFYWLAEHLDLEQPVTLLHFDAHSDASAIFDSDKLRKALRRVRSLGERRELLQTWREKGVVQCFDWIEPLMPAPVAEVIWISPDGADGQATAAEQLDGHLEAAPRATGSFKQRVRALRLAQLEHGMIAGPVIVSIDLDYFSGSDAAERAAAFERVWSFVAEQRDLRAVTIAISRPYLSDDAEAHALLTLALKGALSLPSAAMYFEPFRRVGSDRSLRTREYRAHGDAVPEFDAEQASPELRALLIARSGRISVREDADRWAKTLQHWRAEGAQVQLRVKDHEVSTDAVWRVPVDQPATIEVAAEPWYAPIDEVEWAIEVPHYSRCNLTAATDDAAVFARGAVPRPRWLEIPLSEAGATLPTSALRDHFDAQTGCGALRIKARIRSGGCLRETVPIEVRRFEGSGFRAALSEQFGLPYLFGSGALRSRNDTGPETGWGADCANFLIYALRRQGLAIPWSNPKQLRKHLEPVQGSFAQADVERGLILHLGSHVAALVHDNPPLGVVNDDDVLAHQLEGAPEFIAVGELLKRRAQSSFAILRVPQQPTAVDLIVGGDVMLGRTVGAAVRSGQDPFAGISHLLRAAGTRVANLESPISDGRATKRFDLRAPPAAGASLKSAGWDVLGLANNHANDAGAVAESLRGLRRNGHAVIGVGETLEQAYAAHVVKTASGAEVALLAIDDTSAPSPTVANAADRTRLAAAISRAREAAGVVVMLVHWGEENVPRVTDRQRELARWLIDHGVDVVVGSHPHCIQPLDFYHARPVVYSLGNLVFDGAPTLPSWNRGHLLEISAAESGPPSLRLVPVKLDRRGFPHAEQAPANAQR